MLSVFNKVFNVLKKNVKLIVLFSIVYVLGIILGLVFSKNVLCNNFINININNYYILVFNSSAFTSFLKCFLSGLLLTVAVTLCGFTSFTVYLFSIILFYKGLILGTSLILFYSITSLLGVIVFFILTLPTNAIITFGLIICNVLNFDALRICDFNKRLKKVLLNGLICLLIAIIASIYFIFILLIIIRPINLLF